MYKISNWHFEFFVQISSVFFERSCPGKKNECLFILNIDEEIHKCKIHF